MGHIGACAANAYMLTVPLVDGVRLIDRTFDWKGTAWLLVMVTAMTGVGLFLGVMMGFPWVMPLCGRINGAPLKVGDRVLVLSGRWRGITARVYEIIIGQGKWELARLDLGPEERAKSGDIFEPYSVLKISSGPA
ncbi:MAG: hypothetical protein EOP86_09570 [Verrucomicrobiaceae bacterium]|nr:MAG: hypothetical protein EOP86_09570 [Verrucomicrobiaceae bacterium]